MGAEVGSIAGGDGNGQSSDLMGSKVHPGASEGTEYEECLINLLPGLWKRCPGGLGVPVFH